MSKIFISLGEASADHLGAEIAKEIKSIDTKVNIIAAMGGDLLAKTSSSVVVDINQIGSVMGFSEILLHIPKIKSAFSKIVNTLKIEKPDLLITIDYQDFNLRLAKKAKLLNIPTLHIVLPTIWVWRAKRINILKQYVDKTACIYPFEPDFCKKLSYKKAIYVGNPIFYEYQKNKLNQKEKDKLKLSLGLSDASPLIAIMPGSREFEIKRLLPNMTLAFYEFKKKHPKAKAILPLASTINTEIILRHFNGKLNDIYISNKENIYHLLQISDFGLIKSGTSNLQAAFCQLPFVMLYKTSLISEIIARVLIKNKTFSIVNLIEPNTVKEILQNEINTASLLKEMSKLYEDKKYIQNMKDKFKSLKAQFQPSSSLNPYKNIATIVFKEYLK